MAITKASASGLAGSKFKDASAGTTKIADKPDAPTIGTATNSGAGASVPFTIATRGGTATSFTATSNPGAVSVSGASSPIIVTGLTSGTSYTFTVTATNASGTGPASAASNSVTTIADPVWVLTPIEITSTQNYVASGSVDQIAMVAFGAGFSGNAGSMGGQCGWNETYHGGGGGSGGQMGLAYSGIATVPPGGATYLVTVGAPGGGVTSVGNLLTSSGGGNATAKAAGNVQGGNGTGGNVQVGSGLFTVQNYSYGGSGGAGGSGGDGSNNYTNGAAGQSPFGGGGGKGANYFTGGAGGGGAANGRGGGGGGGGGGTYNTGGAGGGAGATGRVIIFEKKTI